MSFELKETTRLKIISTGSTPEMLERFNDWKRELLDITNAVIREVRCTESESTYTLFIFYDCSREV